MSAGQDEKTIITSDNIVYCKTYSDTTVYFKQHEIKQLRNMGLEPGIEILAFKNAIVDPLYHVDSPYFVSYNSECNYGMLTLINLYKKILTPIYYKIFFRKQIILQSVCQ